MDTEHVDEEVEPQSTSTKSESKRFGLIWRVVAAVVAVVIVVILAYPWVQSQFKEDESINTPVKSQSTAAIPEATVQVKPDSAGAWFELGKAHYQDGQWDQAVDAFQKVIELDPSFQAAYANLGAAYHRQERLDLAVSQYEQALALNPEDGEVIYNLAAVYIQQATQSGQPDPDLLEKAITQLQHALELSPDAAEPYFGLGVAYMVLNWQAEAIDAFGAFLARDSGQDPRASQEAQRYLQMLRGQ